MPVKGQENNLNIHELQDFAESDPNAENIAKAKGGTATDLQDMQRMGRVQELRVRCVAPFDKTIVMDADIFAAELQICRHRWIRNYLASDMGAFLVELSNMTYSC